MASTEPRYLPQYRQDEIRLIFDCAFRGESLCFIGIPGIGKSNVINYLRRSQNYVRPDSDHDMTTLFCVVDATVWQRTPSNLWQLMDTALRKASANLAPQYQEGTVVSMVEEERSLNRLSDRLRWACQELGVRVMFVLDDFDIVFETGPRTILEQLNTLRSEGNRGKLSYLMFTRRLPHVSGRHYGLESSKFFDLIRYTHFALEPYTPEDAWQMLIHLNSTVVTPLESTELPHIQELAGGHARLLRILFDIWTNEGPPSQQPITDSLTIHADVRQECERIFLGLHKAERDVAFLVANSAHTPAHTNVINHLERRGLLIRNHPEGHMRWFSQLFERYLRSGAKQEAR